MCVLNCAFCIGYLGSFFPVMILHLGILTPVVVISTSGAGFQAAGLACKDRQRDYGARLELSCVSSVTLAFFFPPMCRQLHMVSGNTQCFLCT